MSAAGVTGFGAALGAAGAGITWPISSRKARFSGDRSLIINSKKLG